MRSEYLHRRDVTGGFIKPSVPHNRAPIALAAHLLVAGGILVMSAMPADASAQGRQDRRGSRGDHNVDDRKAYSINGGALSTVLTQFGSSAGVFIVSTSDLTAGKVSPGLRGRFSVAEAMDELLSGTGLEAVEDSPRQYRLRSIATVTGATVPAAAAAAASQLSDAKVLPTVTVTAEEALRQAPGVSLITAQDIEKRPPVNDMSELIRTQPGVNLTGASSSGSYGNNRQIDLRGMGPENTMILIDGKPVMSRNAVRMQRNGERDSRGDSNWVPADSIESVEVIRGPAAARYGSGAAGGVVNIITKRPTKALQGSVTTYFDAPEDSLEGSTRRLGFNLAGPVAEGLSFRVYGNVAKTDGDNAELNAAASGIANNGTTLPPAGREGVRNRDLNALLRWDINPDHTVELEAGMSRQGNIYAGERPVSANGTALESTLAHAGAETNIMHRNTASVTHRGKWGDIGTSRLVFQYEGTRRENYPLDQFGAGGDISNTNEMIRSELGNYFVNGELYTPLKIGGLEHVLTTGLEWRKEKLDDPNATSGTSSAGTVLVPGLPTTGTRSGKIDAQSFAFYLEDNVSVTDKLVLTPGVRFDHHDQFGTNGSPSLNTTYALTPEISLKGGIARAFKAPNLYQTNPNYLFFSNGNACMAVDGARPNGCYIQGNPDLRPETSVNKEIGIAFNGRTGVDAGLTYFHNDYKNKIHADVWDQTGSDIPGAGRGAGSGALYRWVNARRAIVRGFEGNLTIPLLGDRGGDLKLLNNLTYMLENKNSDTDQPLSIIPKYTINSTLDWRVNSDISAQLTASFYGTQKARTRSSGYGLPVTGDQAHNVSAYAIYGLGIQYHTARNYRASFGVKNLFDKRLYRGSTSDGAGASTYNEAGRSYYVTLTASF
ncbi:FepA family TonB-dependent siderophore receptor [Paracidovorax cattleyae]|uniref:Outer membrane receptor for ferrienterochelin and colicins n=1 Tax=Paracidovorax cattleyae TaxID=80868 RepID=A0A1H0VFB9_9BURK|nr:FepA family TonB-dependent siderophore receptor [Paracidovorax cattleyae]AVS74678.1 TonB-dependent receptor [Paracidovorax cattleyae]MBF9266593.1 FepA family TonB-dependent siderophore receptor [Paracidovorax cattleyae]SDP77140.1 outer membrane receptor for ferrienterochelin and colicins [Paracidovorax cattleyae]